jgi:uncharacterized repeat protein (TIGR01451 family)
MSKTVLHAIAGIAITASLVVPVFAAAPARGTVESHDARPTRAARTTDATAPAEAGRAVYLVQLAEAPLAAYRGGRSGLAATSPGVTRSKLNRGSAATRAYADFLRTRQDDALRTVAARIGRSPEVRFRYAAAFHRFAVSLTPKEAAAISELDGVRRVQREWVAQPQTDRGPSFIGADVVWAADPANGRGEGVVVGIIDTGINFDSPSFTAAASDGYVHTNPRGRFYGVCDATSPGYDAAFTCNDKLIGAWDFVDMYGMESDGPADGDGHGSHTASTVAGNPVTAVITTPTTLLTRAIGGVAPRAAIIAYDVCLPEYGCPGAALVAAIDQATIDGVDVINFSIGSSSRDPWTSADALAMLGALDAGIFVAVSAGNEGPYAYTLGAPSNAPWVTSVAASTHDRSFTSTVTGITDGITTFTDIPGASITAGYGPATIVDAADFSSTLSVTMTDGLCQAPFPVGAFDGEIVVCQRGGNGRTDKGANVLAGGAGGMILVNDVVNGDSLSADMHELPAVHIGHIDGVTLRNLISASAVVTGSITPFAIAIDAAQSDVIAAFSSRGPDYTTRSVLKPDVAAPGVDIIAAGHEGDGYLSLSGTSMASPHTAGAAALLVAQHPEWTPSEIRSALMLSARTTMTKEDQLTPAGPFDRGAGRISVPDADAAQLVLDESAPVFYSADPAFGGDPSSLNLASLMQSKCVAVCSWTRTFRNAGDSSDTWTIGASAFSSATVSASPISFTLDAGRTQVVTFTVDVSTAAVDAWHFGVVTLTASTVAHMPVAAYSVRGDALEISTDIVDIPIRDITGSLRIDGLRSIDSSTITGSTFSGSPTNTVESVAQDPTPGDIFDAPSTLFTTTIPVTASTRVVSVRTSNTTASDLDLYIGVDVNANKQLDPNEFVCISATTTTDESCLIRDPGYDVVVAVQNFAASQQITDTFTLSILALADATSPAVTIRTPNTATSDAPFHAEIDWNLPNLPVDESHFTLIEVGTSPSHTNDILSRILRFTQVGDDVTIEADTATLSDDAGYLQPGQAVAFTTTLAPLIESSNGITYLITATLPEGIDYLTSTARLAGRALTTNAEPVIVGRTAVWSQFIPRAVRQYVLYTNDPTRPDYSAMCQESYSDSSLLPLFPALAGDEQTWNFESLTRASGEYSFFGRRHSLLYFTDDGLLSFDARSDTPGATYSGTNSFIAPFRADMEVVYDASEQRGIRLHSGEGAATIDYAGIQPKGDPSARLSMRARVHRTVDSTRPEILFLYGPISGTLPSAQIGMQSIGGAASVDYTGTITPNLTLCFDWSIEPIVLHYSGVVRSDVRTDVFLTTTVETRPNSHGAPSQITSLPMFVSSMSLHTAILAPERIMPGLPVTYTILVTNSGMATATNLTAIANVPLGATHHAGGVHDGGNVTFTVASLAAGTSTALQFSVMPNFADAARTAPGRPSIISGTTAAPGAWPWQAALFNNSAPSAETGLWCGGSLISPDFVLTAAHCVDGITAADIRVLLGRTSLSGAGGQEIFVSEVIAHPKYHYDSLDYDIALLRLATPAELNSSVQPIRTASPAYRAQFATGVTATILGWGATDFSSIQFGPDELQQAQVSIVDQAACASDFAELGYDINGNMICAGSRESGADTCYGDNGGPLIVPNGGGWLLAGITNGGFSCGTSSVPSIYTRVSAFADYVRDMQHSLGPVAVTIGNDSGFAGHSSTAVTVGRTVAQSRQDLRMPMTALR